MVKNIPIENPYISITLIEILTLHKMLYRKLQQQLQAESYTGIVFFAM